MTKRKQQPARHNARVVLANDLIMGRPTPMLRRLGPPDHRAFLVFLGLLERVKPRKDVEFEAVSLTPPQLWETFFGQQHRPTVDEVVQVLDQCARMARLVFEPPNIRPVRFFSKAGYNVDTRLVTVQLHDELKPYSLGMKRDFTSAAVASLRALRSPYAKWLYWIARQWVRYDYKKEFVVPLPDLLASLCVPLHTQAAREWRRFRRDILEPAKQEIERLTELRFSYAPVRDGRTDRQRGPVDAVVFYDLDVVTNDTNSRENQRPPASVDSASSPASSARETFREPNPIEQARERVRRALALEAGQRAPVDLSVHYDPYAD